MVSVNGILSGTWSYLKAYPEFVCGTGNDIFAQTLKKSFYGVKDGTKGLHFSQFGKQIGDAFDSTIKYNAEQTVANGGFFKSLGKSFTSIPDDFKALWKAGTEAATAANKTGLSKLWTQTKSSLGVIGKRMPLIGTILLVGMEIPNIFKATTEDSLLSGIGETAKAGARIGLGTVGGAIGTALVPIPLVGTILGYMAGEFLGSLILGKTYSQKQEAQKAEIVKTAAETAAQGGAQGNAQGTNNGGGTSGGGGAESQFGTNVLGQQPMSDEDFQKLQQQYMQFANPQNQDYMMQMSGIK